MKPRLKSAVVLGSVFFCSTLFVFAGAPPDLLWQKALAVAGTNTDWVPGLAVMRSEVLYKGETNGVHEIWTRSKPGTNGEVLRETIKVVEDGKDVTEQEKKKEAKEKKEKGKTQKAGVQGMANPFDAETQARLTLNVTNRSRNIAGRDCVGYAFEVRNTNGPKMRGIAWLEKERGIPAELENVTLDPLPDKHLKGMTMTTRYESTADGAWRVKQIRTVGRVSKLFINADFQSTMTFSEYWQRPPSKVIHEKGRR